MKNTKQMLTISEVGKLLGVHPDTLRRWEKSGRLVPVRYSKGGHRRYPVERIMQMIKVSTVEETLPSPTLERVIARGQKEPNNVSTKDNPVGRFMVAVGAVIEHTQTKKILLVHRHESLDWQPGKWEIVYGRLDQMEDPIAGLKREIKEEVGITSLSVKRVINCWHIFRGSQKPENELVGVTYWCVADSTKVKLSGEHSKYKWCSVEEALELVEMGGIREDLEIFARLRGNFN